MNAAIRRSDHDQRFKNVFVENPRDAITFAMPKCADYFSSQPEIIPIREETLKTFLWDSFMEIDVPLLVKYQNAGFVFLIEHQHDPYAFSIYHLARCVSHLQEQYKCDVIPIVYFPNASPRSRALVQEFKSEFMGKCYHSFTYFKLGKTEWEAYQTYLKQKNQEEVFDMINTMLKEQGRVEGELVEGQKTLLMLLPQRLGPTPAEIEKNIRALNDLDRIHAILARFLEIKDWQELEQLLNGGAKN